MTKKIAYIITRSDIGGAQNHLISLIKHFSQKYKLLLIVGSEGALTDVAESHGADVRVVKSLDSANFFSAIYELRKHLNLHQPDVVHTHSSLASLYGRIAAKMCNIKTVYTVHGWHFANLNNPFKARCQIMVEFLLKRLTSQWIVVSLFDKDLGQQYKLFNKNAVECIPNGVPDLQSGQHVRKDTHFKLVFVGRASYQKNYLAAIEILEQSHKQVSLTIYTSGREVAELLTRVETSPAKGRCEVIVDANNAGSLLNQYDLMIVTSRYEGMPLSVLEGLRAGLPIVSTDVCGMKEIVRPENGYLVSLENVVDISKWVEMLRLDEGLRTAMSKASRALYEAQFTETDMLASVEYVYTRLLK